MGRILFFNRPEDARALLKEHAPAVSYAVLDDFIRDRRVREILDSESRFHRIDLKEYMESETFRKAYIEFISGLNKENNSVLWWCLNLSDKNPVTSRLPKRIWNILALEGLIAKEKPDILAVFTEDAEIAEQMRITYTERGIAIENRIALMPSPADRLNAIFPVKITMAFLRSCTIKVLAHAMVPRRRHPSPGAAVVMRTLINHQSFKKEGRFVDTYFGELCDFIQKQVSHFVIFANITHPLFANMKKLRRNRTRFSFLLLEQIMTWRELVHCFFVSLKTYRTPLRPKGDLVFCGVDVAYILQRAIDEECRAHKLFTNYLNYYSTVSLARRVPMARFLYPFEHRGWEKLSVKAIQDGQKGVKVIAYQHASFSLMLMDFFLGDQERSVTPLPDELVTMGSVTREIFKSVCNFPESILRTGCGLRQNRKSAPVSRREKKRITRLLVPLGLSPEEYVKGLIFLNETFKEKNDWEIHLRPHPHPIIPIDEALTLVPDLRFRYHIDRRPTIDQSLNEADLILYFSSTVSIESLIRGIPVINIDPGFFLSPDPLFDMHDLKWSVTKPDKLQEAIRDIDAITREEYDDLKEKAYRYANDYICPVTDESMEVFLK